MFCIKSVQPLGPGEPSQGRGWCGAPVCSGGAVTVLGLPRPSKHPLHSLDCHEEQDTRTPGHPAVLGHCGRAPGTAVWLPGPALLLAGALQVPSCAAQLLHHHLEYFPHFFLLSHPAPENLRSMPCFIFHPLHLGSFFGEGFCGSGTTRSPECRAQVFPA